MTIGSTNSPEPVLICSVPPRLSAIVAALTSSSSPGRQQRAAGIGHVAFQGIRLPLPLAADIVAVAQRVLDVERAAAGRFQQPGIGDGVAGVDRQRLATDVGVDGPGMLVLEGQIGVGVADAVSAGDVVVDVIERLAGP